MTPLTPKSIIEILKTIATSINGTFTEASSTEFVITTETTSEQLPVRLRLQMRLKLSALAELCVLEAVREDGEYLTFMHLY